MEILYFTDKPCESYQSRWVLYIAYKSSNTFIYRIESILEDLLPIYKIATENRSEGDNKADTELRKALSFGVNVSNLRDVVHVMDVCEVCSSVI